MPVEELEFGKPVFFLRTYARGAVLRDPEQIAFRIHKKFAVAQIIQNLGREARLKIPG
jgi:hypothetical protein